MNEKTVIKLLKIITLISIILLILLNDSYYLEDEQKIVKCYDRHHNEIIGQKCVNDETTFNEYMFLNAFIVLVGILTYFSFSVMDFD